MHCLATDETFKCDLKSFAYLIIEERNFVTCFTALSRNKKYFHIFFVVSFVLSRFVQWTLLTPVFTHSSGEFSSLFFVFVIARWQLMCHPKWWMYWLCLKLISSSMARNAVNRNTYYQPFVVHVNGSPNVWSIQFEMGKREKHWKFIRI